MQKLYDDYDKVHFAFVSENFSKIGQENDLCTKLLKKHQNT